MSLACIMTSGAVTPGSTHNVPVTHQMERNKPLSNAERQRRWRERHPREVALRRWLKTFDRLLRNCPDHDIVMRQRAALRVDRGVTGGVA